MMNRFYSSVLLAGLSILLIVPAARGGGLWLYEQGTPDLGTAGAGRAALAADASTAYANPAGMARLDRSQMLAAVQGLYIDSRFDTELSGFGGGAGGNAGGFMPGGSLHYVQSLSPDIKLGITAGSFFGLGIDYGDDWAGRYYTTEADLLTFALNPALAYRVCDWLSAGVGFTVLYADFIQKAAINNSAVPGQAGMADGRLDLESDDISYGFNLGVLLEPVTGTRFGLTYRSEMDLDFEDSSPLKNIGPVLQGLLETTGLYGSKVDIDMTIPRTAMLSCYQQLNDDWAVMGNIGWQDWSEFGKQELSLNSTRSVSFTSDLDYDDTWHFALGSQYRIINNWLWSVGVAYDTSPIDDSANRTPSLPLDRQIRIGTGVQYDCSEDVTIGLAYEYVDTGAAKIDQPGGALQGPLEGKYSTNAIQFFAGNLIWRF